MLGRKKWVTSAALLLGGVALVAGCSSTTATSEAAASASVESAATTGADPVEALLATLDCPNADLWESAPDGTWAGFNCPEEGKTGVPARVYMFQTSADQQMFSQRAYGLTKQWGYDTLVAGEGWIAFGYQNAHRDFLVNAVNQGGQLIQ